AGAPHTMPLVPLLVYVVVEILAFVLLTSWIGVGWTVLLLVGLFVLGVVLAARQFRAVARRALRDTRHPGAITADAALLLVGSVGVALPGVVTTVLGLVLIVPWTRAGVRRLLGSAVRRRLERFGGSSFATVTGFGMRGAADGTGGRGGDTSAGPSARRGGSATAPGRGARGGRPPGWGEIIDHRDDEFDR
ncbi:FxsA family protein, partial [Corynebacterium bovis]|uniref:FxsA family protein n=2 Tax=Corynebacterium bovis TaxID=36808 RepID=UPI00313A0F36